MQPLPTYLSSEIFKNLFFYQNYFCCEIDPKNIILQTWGDGSKIGLDEWTVNKNIEDAGFTQGMPNYDSWVLHDVKVSDEHHADIYFSPTLRGKKYLLFAPKTEAVNRLKVYQQFHHNAGLNNNTDVSKLQQNNLIDSEFISTVSKHMSAPLSMILGSTYLLKMQSDLPEAVSSQINVVDRATNEMMLILGNLRDYMFFDDASFRLDINNTSLESLLQQVTTVFTPLAANKNVICALEVTEHCPSYLQVDSIRVKQVLLNLLNHCLPYVDNNRIDLLIDEVDSFLVATIDFSSNSPLVNPLETESENVDDHLALDVTKKIILEMQARFAFMQTNNEVNFTLVIPYTLSSALTQEKMQSVEETDEESNTILLVSDDPIRSVRYKSYLNAMGFDVTLAADGQLGLALIEQVPFNFVITELELPYISGQEMTKTLRENGSAIPIIAFSDSDDVDHLSELKELGCTSVLKKPVNFKILSSEMEKYA